ncbi:MAG TPA: Holliday junction branch migration protein RuvA [Chlamydiales bacterium]|jgi:Holliday junction DNA helicase RuvA|nr:Holliday junction branch migration protein RuvA [Chlamydiales bacterium]
MYEFIKGLLVDKDPMRAIVETGGIGYRLTIPLSTYTQLPAIKTVVQLYLSHIVREDAELLYAFASKEERDLFELIITVSGIGPKIGTAIIGHIDIASFHRAIAGSDLTLLSKIPGIGRKTAERLVIEMRDKLSGAAKKGKGLPATLSLDSAHPLTSDAFRALVNLGYQPLDAQKAVATTLKKNSDETDLGRFIALALQQI